MRLLSWSITGMFLKSPGGGFQMEEEPRTLQVPSSAISSICAVISNYWSLIEVHVEYSRSLSPSLEADEYPPLTYYTKWHSWRSDVSSQSSFSAPSLSSPPAPPQFEKTAGTLWCLAGLALGHLHCCIWQGIYSCYSQDAEIVFYMAPCCKYLSWASFTASWHLKIDNSHLETKMTEMLWLLTPLDAFFYICQKDPQVISREKKKSTKIMSVSFVLYLLFDFELCFSSCANYIRHFL